MLPWLNPFAGGPSPAVVPWLTSLACICIFLLLTLAVRVDFAAIPAAPWLAAAVLSSALGLLQYFGAAAAISPWVNNTSAGEAFANLRQRNQFATLTNIGLAALFCWSAGTRWRASKSHAYVPDLSERRAFRIDKVLPIGAALLLSAGNAASSSRTGMVQLILLCVVIPLWRGFRDADTLRVSVAAGIGYAAAALVLPRLAGLDPSAIGILARLHDGGPTCASRLTLWSNVLYLIAQKPWSGWGWGELDYAHFTTLYPGARFCDILDNAHNLPLHLAVELGIPVAVLVCGLGMWLVWRSRPWQETDPSRQMAWAVLAVILLHSMLEYPLWYGPFQIAAGLCVWILWSTRQTVRADAATNTNTNADADADAEEHRQVGGHQSTHLSLVKIITACIALVVLAGVMYTAWDYRRISQIYLAPDMRAPAYRENTMAKINDSWLFHNQVQFAELTTSDVTADNAQRINAMAHDLLHFSPESRVVEKLIDSALVLGRDEEALFYEARFRAAFPSDYARWVETKGGSVAAQLPLQ
jgi:O-antigen ligase